jgi:hypothetical protein
MQIQDHLDCCSPHYFLQLALYVEYLCDTLVHLLVPAPIQVVSCHVAAVVAQHHAINVHHREYVKLKLLQQHLHLLG